MLRTTTILAAAILAVTGSASAQNYPWKPERPITIIVPWAAGGSTDQVTRVAAVEIEKALGQKVVIVNQGGASGSIGTKSALDAAQGRLYLDRRRRQGHRHLCGERAARHQAFPTGAPISAWSTCRCSASIRTRPYKDAKDLVDAMKAKPNGVSVATAGINSSGHAAIEAFTRALGAHLQAREL